MLRNSAALPGLSRPAGPRLLWQRRPAHVRVARHNVGPDGKKVAREIEPGVGPVITSAIRMPDELEGGEGARLLSGGRRLSQFGGWMLEMLEEPEAIAKALPKVAHYVWSLIHGQRHSEVGDLASALLGDCDLSSGLLPLLGMGRDIPGGKMRSRRGAWSSTGPRTGAQPLISIASASSPAKSRRSSAPTSWTTRSGT